MSSLISAGDITGMRHEANRSLAGSAIILRKTSTDDGQGGSDTNWLPVGTVSFNLAPINQRGESEQVTADQIRVNAMRYGVFPALTDVRSADQVGYQGDLYEVLSVNEPRPVELLRKTILVRVT